jgi:ribonuclease HII
VRYDSLVTVGDGSVLVIGVDEAGRGPVLGPLVMCGVALSPRRAATLTRAGVADSKSFGAGAVAHERRLTLAALVRRHAEAVVLRVVDPAVVDARVERGELNVLERELAGQILRALPPARRIVADGARMFAPMALEWPHLEARDQAEGVHVAVAAASVVAKAHRDELFACIARRYQPEFGPLEGGGYTNAGTRKFLDAYHARHGRLPPEARVTWGNAEDRRQMKLALGTGELAPVDPDADVSDDDRPPASVAAVRAARGARRERALRT